MIIDSRIEEQLVPVALDDNGEPLFDMRLVAIAFANDGERMAAAGLILPETTFRQMRELALELVEKQAIGYL